MDLNQTPLQPCPPETLPMAEDQQNRILLQLPEWQIVVESGVARLSRCVVLRDFDQAMLLANQVARLAEQYQHHPQLVIVWGRLTIQWWTHSISGLHINDFILAAHTDALIYSEKDHGRSFKP